MLMLYLICHARAGMHSKHTTVIARSRRWRTSCSGLGERCLQPRFPLVSLLCLQPRSSRHVCCSYDNDLATKGEFYPTLNKSQLFPDYIAEKSGHSRGSTLDLTLVNFDSTVTRYLALVTLCPQVQLPVRPQAVFVPGQTLQPCFERLGVRFDDNR